MDEGGVGPVLQQAAHQIGQQVLVGADRRIDAAVQAGIVVQHRVVQLLPHAVQALEFELAIARHLQNADHGIGVVGGELGGDKAAGRLAQQVASAGEVGDIGTSLAGKQRVAGQARLLGIFQFAVPVGAFYQSHRNEATLLAGQRGEPAQYRQSALGVGLHHHAELAPATVGIGAVELLEQVQRQLESVHLLGIDADGHILVTGQPHQTHQPLAHLAEHPFTVGHVIARMQGREFDGDGGGRAAVADPLIADRLDGVAIIGQVFVGILQGEGRFTQHVVGVGVAQLAGFAARLEGFFHVAPQHELLAHDLHGGIHGGAHHRLPQLVDHATQQVGRIAVELLVELDDLAGQHQPPGGGVDQSGVAFAEMGRPVGAGELVLDQGVGGLGIGNTQQRLSQTHQDDPLLGIQAVLLQEGVDTVTGAALLAHLGHQHAGALGHLLQRGTIHRQHGRQFGQIGIFIHHVVLGDGFAQGGQIGGNVVSSKHVSRFEHRGSSCTPEG